MNKVACIIMLLLIGISAEAHDGHEPFKEYRIQWIPIKETDCIFESIKMSGGYYHDVIKCDRMDVFKVFLNIGHKIGWFQNKTDTIPIIELVYYSPTYKNSSTYLPKEPYVYIQKAWIIYE